MTRVLLLAHGDGRRWDVDDRPFLGRPKHFVHVDGETLLARTVRLMTGRGCEVVVVGPDDRYDVPGARRVSLDAINSCGSDMGKLLDTRHLWADADRTVIMWGDCYYTDDVADAVAFHLDLDYHVWRRPGRSAVTGARWDESLAVSFGPQEHQRVVMAAERVAAAVRAGVIPKSHIRTHLAAMCHVPDALLDDVKHTATLPAQTHVDDWSDDFDSPAEWRTWMRRRFQHDGLKVGVCIPWREGEAGRVESFQWSLDWWRRLGVSVYLGDDTVNGPTPNRSAMRNDAARKAINDGCDVLFFADSDTFVGPDEFWAAVCRAHHERKVVLAYERYVLTGRHHVRRYMRRGVTVTDQFRRGMSTRGATVRRGHVSGAVVVPVVVWQQLGGFDERFTRWGYEDRAFWCAATTLTGEVLRVPGDAFHWWHPAGADKDRRAEDMLVTGALVRRYYIATAWVPETGAVHRAIEAGLLDPIVLPDDAGPDPDAMRALLAEPGGPLAHQMATA